MRRRMMCTARRRFRTGLCSVDARMLRPEFVRPLNVNRTSLAAAASGAAIQGVRSLRHLCREDDLVRSSSSLFRRIDRCESAVRLRPAAGLQLQQALLSPKPAPVPSEFSILINDPVTRHDDRDAVQPVRMPDRSTGTGRTDAAGDFLV